MNNVFYTQIAYLNRFFSVKSLASFKLKNDCVDDNNGPVHHRAIFDYNNECNATTEKLIKLSTGKSHADNENDVTFFDVTDNSSGNCKSKQNYASVTNSCKTGVNQCNNSLRCRNCADCDKFFKVAITRISQTRFAAIKHLSIKTQVYHKFSIVPAPLLTASKLKIQTYQIIYLIYCRCRVTL